MFSRERHFKNNPGLFQARWNACRALMQFLASGAAGFLVMAYGSEAVGGFRRMALSPIQRAAGD
jgi:hypothetical protein